MARDGENAGSGERRGRRYAWLTSAHATLGAAAPLVDDAEAAGLDIEDLRARIAAARAIIELTGAIIASEGSGQRLVADR